MPQGAFVAVAVRGAVLLVALALPLAASVLDVADAQTSRTAVSVAPAQLPPVSVESGAFAVWVQVGGIDHHGSIDYDTDRDTVPDRSEPSAGFGGFEFTVRFNPAKLAVHQARPGDDLAGDSQRSFQCLQRSDEPGSFSFGCASTGDGPGRQGSFPLAEVSFLPVGSGSALVALEEIQLSGPLADDIPIEVSNSAAAIYIESNGPPDTSGPDGNDADAPDASDGVVPAVAGTDGSPGNDGSGAPPEAGADEGDSAGSDGGGQPDSDTADGRSAGARDDGADGAQNRSGPALGGSGEENGAFGGLGVALWSAAVAAGVVAAGALGLGVFRWRRFHARN